MRFLKKVLFGDPFVPRTKEDVDRIVAKLSKGTLAEAEEYLGISWPGIVLAQKRRVRRRKMINRLLGIAS